MVMYKDFMILMIKTYWYTAIVDFARSTGLVFNVTISAGSTSSSFGIDIVNDMIQEDNETFNIAMRLLPSCLSLSPGTASSTVMIIDDDGMIVYIKMHTFCCCYCNGFTTSILMIMVINFRQLHLRLL